MPEISVVVPARNAALTLEACLASVKGSEFRDYELIVVDDASTDGTLAIAERYAHAVVRITEAGGKRSSARRRGIEASKGGIIVNIDADVVIRPDALSIISGFFSNNPDVSAVTGKLARAHPNSDFFSQYKNLYMHYNFTRLPREVDFLYGSIYALRRDCLRQALCNVDICDDTALGQDLAASGKRIVFLDTLEVVHLKRYSPLSFLKNDLLIPFEWARIFMTHAGWRQLCKGGTGYAHAPKGQLACIVLAPAIAAAVIAIPLTSRGLIPAALAMVLAWIALNFRFLAFLASEKGIVFGIVSTFVTFIDNIVMAAGVISGTAAFAFHAFRANRKTGR